MVRKRSVLHPKPQGTIKYPVLYDIRRGDEIGNSQQSHFQWIPCDDCGTPRWIVFRLKDMSLPFYNTQSNRCRKCSRSKVWKGKTGNQAANWRGGVAKTYDKRMKIEVLSHYTIDGQIKCADPFHMHFSPITDLDILTLDHINGNGWKDRKKDLHTYRQLKRDNYPLEYQILCWNCQAKKAILYGERQKAFAEKSKGKEAQL